MSRFGPAVRKGLFLAIGILAAAIGAYGTKMIQQANETKDWPTTQGKIIAAEIRPGNKVTPTRPLIRFEYELRGTVFHSEQYRQGLAGTSVDKVAADALLKKYPVGAQVRVHYDPYNAFNSVLEEGDPTLGYLVCSAAVVLLGAGAILILGHRKKK